MSPVLLHLSHVIAREVDQRDVHGEDATRPASSLSLQVARRNLGDQGDPGGVAKTIKMVDEGRPRAANVLPVYSPHGQGRTRREYGHRTLPPGETTPGRRGPVAMDRLSDCRLAGTPPSRA